MELQDKTMEYMIDQSQDFHGRKITTAPRRVVAKALGVSPTTIWNHLKRLERSNKIRSFYHRGLANIFLIK